MSEGNGDAPVIAELEFNERVRLAELFYAAIITRNPGNGDAFDVAFSHADIFMQARERARRTFVK